jgi:hypothetical protein
MNLVALLKNNIELILVRYLNVSATIQFLNFFVFLFSIKLLPLPKMMVFLRSFSFIAKGIVPKDARWGGLPFQPVGLPAPSTHTGLKSNPLMQSGLERSAHVIPTAPTYPVSIGTLQPSSSRAQAHAPVAWLLRRCCCRHHLH